LQRRRAEGDEAIGVRRAPFGQAVVVNTDDLGGQVAIGRVPPKSIDVESLDVNAALVELLNAIGSEGTAAAARETLERRTLQHFRNFSDSGMGVNVDYFDALTANADLAAHRGRAGLRRRNRFQHPARNKSSSRRIRHRPDEFSAIPHPSSF
jgi:hypothetical protein